MRLGAIVILLIVSTFLPVSAEDKLDIIYNHIAAGDLVAAERATNDFELNSINTSNDSVLSDFYYLKGVLQEQKGDAENAITSFIKSYELGENVNYNNDLSHLDAMFRIMRWFFEHDDYNECAVIGKKAIKMPEVVLESYPGTPYLFSTLATSMSSLMKYAAVPDIVQKGLHYVQSILSPQDESYYELSICEAVAYLMMQKPEKTDSILTELKYAYSSSGTVHPNLEAGFEALGQEINKSRQTDWAIKKEREKEAIESVGSKILLASPQSPEGSKIWKQYFQMIRGTLEFYYFDPTDVEDEAFWNWCLAQLITRFYVCCDGMPGRSCESYNNVLLKKNFLEYHYGKLHKEPCTWETVADMLDDNEAAIEISQMPDEFLIVKKGINAPISIPVDSILFEELSNADIHDALAISDLYSENNSLHKLWLIVEPYLEGIETIYLSASHVFARFNYSAISLSPDITVADKYRVINVLSTADIEHVKKNQEAIEFKNALLYGGIEYDVNQNQMLAEAKLYRNPTKTQKWSMTRGLPTNTRRNLEYLKESLAEVISIDSTLRQNHIATRVLTGASANEESIKSFAGNSVDLIHVSTHGFMLAPLFSSDKGEEVRRIIGNRYQTILSQSGIFLAGAKAAWIKGEDINGAEDGILTSREIAEMNLDGVKLATLSACDTGLGDDSNLTGAQFGVLHAFKLAGVEKLLVCLWQVDDEATSLFMKSFYRNLLATGNYSDALCGAKKELISTGYDNPYYWAPFVIIE